MSDDTVLTVRALRTGFETRAGFVEVVRDVSFSLRREEILGIVVESGSGKSITAYSMMALVDPPGRGLSGGVTVGETHLLQIHEESIRRTRGTLAAMLIQDPTLTLTP